MKRVPKALFAFPECRAAGRRLARALRVPFGEVRLHRFPDGESLVRLPFAAKRAALYRPLERPNAKIVEAVLALSALRLCGARRITLVAPYLPYMRQDKVFRAGEALSQSALGKMLGPWCDAVVAVEPHLHRTRTLEKVFAGRKGAAVSGAKALARHFRKHGIAKDTFVLGPDEEAFRVARPLAEALGLSWGTARKQRRGDRKVALTLGQAARVKERPVLIADDMISTGVTVIAAARAAKKAGAASVSVAVVHALYDAKAARAMKKAGVKSVVSCDGVPHPSNRASLTPDLAAALKGLL